VPVHELLHIQILDNGDYLVGGIKEAFDRAGITSVKVVVKPVTKPATSPAEPTPTAPKAAEIAPKPKATSKPTPEIVAPVVKAKPKVESSPKAAAPAPIDATAQCVTQNYLNGALVTATPKDIRICPDKPLELQIADGLSRLSVTPSSLNEKRINGSTKSYIGNAWNRNGVPVLTPSTSAFRKAGIESLVLTVKAAPPKRKDAVNRNGRKCSTQQDFDRLGIMSIPGAEKNDMFYVRVCRDKGTIAVKNLLLQGQLLISGVPIMEKGVKVPAGFKWEDYVDYERTEKLFNTRAVLAPKNAAMEAVKMSAVKLTLRDVRAK